MSAKVVNTKHVADKKTGLLPDGVVYISRFQFWGKYVFKQSPLANDFGVKRYGLEEALRRYEERLRSKPDLMAKLPELRGKTLACWCAGEEGPQRLQVAPELLHPPVERGGVESHHPRKQVREKPLGIPQKRSFALHAPQLLEQGECDDLGIRKPLYGLVVSSTVGVEMYVSVGTGSTCARPTSTGPTWPRLT